ncbi:MAG: hypothetical protein R3C19_04660 [Planctomycetaceae bacterium]
MPAEPLKSEAVRALRQQLFRSEQRSADYAVVSTGFQSLDDLLPHRGLSTGSIVEWISSGPGQMTMSLAMTCALPLLTKPGAFAVPDPECQFHPAAAVALGLPLSRLLLIRPANHSVRQERHSAGVCPGNLQRDTPRRGALRQDTLRRDTLWTLEQLARCSGVRIIVCRLDRISSTALRRLQLAVERSGVTVFLIRPASALKQPSWADLRLHVQPLNSDDAWAESGYAAGAVSVKLLRSRYSVQHHGCARFGIDDETSTVFEIPELVGAAAAATPRS